MTSCFEPSGHQCSEGAENVKNFKFCAYHSYFHVGAATFIYADNPYDQTSACVAESPNESPSDHAISGGLAHEHSESVTDPETAGGSTKRKKRSPTNAARRNPKRNSGRRSERRPTAPPTTS